MYGKFQMSHYKCFRYSLYFTLTFLTLLSEAFAAGPFYIRDGATGTTCSDWSLANACDSLPATLQRNSVYYVAGGFYPAYTFNTVESGTSLITVKKATASDHGTETGWVASLGTTQAEFASYFNITRSYFTIDGSYRNESNWFDGTAYGFKIQETGNWQHMRIFDPAGSRSVSDITVKYIYIKAIVGRLPASPATGPNNHCYTSNGTPVGPCAINTNTESSTVRGYRHIYSRVFIEGSNNPYFLRFTVDPLLEYSASINTSGSAEWHGEVVNRYFSPEGTRGGGVIRYNHYRNSYNGASGYQDGGSTGVIVVSETSGIEIYGNIFEDWLVGNGAVGAGWTNRNMKVHHNTFIDGYSVIENGNGTVGNVVQFPTPGTTASGNEAYNNLSVNVASWKDGSSANYSGQGTAANNIYLLTPGNLFVNPTGHDFRLKAATSSEGRTLASPYNVDLDGKVRDSDGFLDIGAFEFTAGSTSAPGAPTGLRITGN